MDLLKSRRRKSNRVRLKNLVAVTGLVISLSCIMILMISILRLPGISTSDKSKDAKTMETTSVLSGLNQFGETVVNMLPDDLAFTVFVPSPKAFERHLRFIANGSAMAADEADNVYATLTRVLGFSAVPRKMYSDSVGFGDEICLDSVSGFRLYVSKDVDGRLMVNGVRSEWVDMKKGEIVVHIMDGVIMDAEFTQSVQPEKEEEEENQL